MPDPDAGVRFMEIRGTGEQIRLDAPSPAGAVGWIIRIHPRRLISYNVVGSGGHAPTWLEATRQDLQSD